MELNEEHLSAGGATILCGIIIGENAVVGAASVMTHDAPDGATVVGVPARTLKKAVAV